MTTYTFQLLALFALLGTILAVAVYAALQARRGRRTADNLADTLASHGACLSGIATAVKSPVIVPTGGGGPGPVIRN